MTNVLNTRPRGQAAELSRPLLAAGFTPIEAPAIATASAWLPAELAAARQALRAGDYAWVVLASANAGRDLVRDLQQARVCCGASTARALDLRAEIALDRFSASAALTALQSVLEPGDRVLLPRAADGRDELPDGLRAMGVNLDAPTAYRTLVCDASANRLEAGDIDVITVCSPSAVSSLRLGLERHPEVPVVALGETTAAALRAAGLRVAAMANNTSMQALVDAVQGVVSRVPA
jgi:uroporphyrinogen III methyltransferase/synthase